MSYEQTIEEKVNQRIQQFLVHSFIYYELNENVTADYNYDRICKELYEFKEQGLVSDHKYESLVEGLDKSGSGFYIREYPKPIITTALRLLHFCKYDKENWSLFLGRFGYSADNSKGDVHIENDTLYLNKDIKMTKDEIWTDQKVKVKRGKTLKSGVYEVMAVKDSIVKILFKKHYYFIDLNKYK